MSDFVPQKDSELIDWLTNYSDKLESLGVTVGVAAGDVTAMQSRITDYKTLHSTTEDMKQTLQSSIQNRTDVKAQLLEDIRAQIRRFKEDPGYSAQIGEDFDVIGESQAFDSANFKTTLKARQIGGDVRVDFSKGQTDGVNLYTRLNGQGTWTFLARDTQSPYIDNRPLATPGTPEHREYMARGVVEDAEIGVDSDIVSVVYSG